MILKGFIDIKFLEIQSAVFVVILTGILLTPNALTRANWPGFRGPTGPGFTTQENLPIGWVGPANKNVLWISPIADPKGRLFFANANKSYVV